MSGLQGEVKSLQEVYAEYIKDLGGERRKWMVIRQGMGVEGEGRNREKTTTTTTTSTS